MGQRGRERVLTEFSREKMTDAFDREVLQLSQSTASANKAELKLLYIALQCLPIVAAILAAVVGFAPAKKLLARTR